MKRIFIAICLVLSTQTLLAQSTWVKFFKLGNLITIYQEASRNPVTVIVSSEATLGMSPLLIAGAIFADSTKSFSSFCEEWVFVGLQGSTLIFDVSYTRRYIFASDGLYPFIGLGVNKGAGSEDYSRSANLLCLVGNADKEDKASARYLFYLPLGGLDTISSITPRTLFGKSAVRIYFDRSKFVVGADLIQ